MTTCCILTNDIGLGCRNGDLRVKPDVMTMLGGANGTGNRL